MRLGCRVLLLILGYPVCMHGNKEQWRVCMLLTNTWAITTVIPRTTMLGP
jgi:hypothetical protein